MVINMANSKDVVITVDDLREAAKYVAEHFDELPDETLVIKDGISMKVKDLSEFMKQNKQKQTL